MAIQIRKEGASAADQKKEWEIVFKGKLVAVERHIAKGFERAVRPPGVRLLLENDQGDILITKEFRQEHGKYDYRLPGGKVFDDLNSYLAVRNDPDALHLAVMRAAHLEARQEAGAEEIGQLAILFKSIAGTTFEWDLFYLTGKVLKMGLSELSDDEEHDLVGADLYPKEEVLKMLKSGEISEDRTVAALYRYLAAD